MKRAQRCVLPWRFGLAVMIVLLGSRSLERWSLGSCFGMSSDGKRAAGVCIASEGAPLPCDCLCFQVWRWVVGRSSYLSSRNWCHSHNMYQPAASIWPWGLAHFHISTSWGVSGFPNLLSQPSYVYYLKYLLVWRLQPISLWFRRRTSWSFWWSKQVAQLTSLHPETKAVVFEQNCQTFGKHQF
jgi:hypothetical protein